MEWEINAAISITVFWTVIRSHYFSTPLEKNVGQIYTKIKYESKK